MRDELKQPHTLFPGLQIFSSWKGSQRIGRNDSVSSRSTLAPTKSEDILSGVIQNEKIPSHFGTWTKISERKSTELHDYSPTIVVSDYFEQSGGLGRTGAGFWDRITREIFKELPFSNSDQFLEEFQYAVISSDFLNDPHGFRFSFAGKKSIMDFHKRSELFRELAYSTIPTKYGRLKISLPSKFSLFKTFDYLPTIFMCFRILKGLQRLKQGKVIIRRVLATVLIALYLAIQQEYFHAQYTKYKALISLKSMLDSLQKISVLLHKFHIKLKELNIYKPLTYSLPHHGPDNVILKIKDLLSSCLDLLYYKLRLTTQDLIILSSTTSLSKYCEVYNLEISDLYHYLNEPAIEIEDKAKRVIIAKKFMLCTILSLSSYSSSCDLPMHNFLIKIFPDYNFEDHQSHYYREVDKYKSVTTSLSQLSDFIVQLTTPLVNHKALLLSSGETPPESSDGVSNCEVNVPIKNRQIYATLSSLRQLENTLVASGEQEVSKETNDLVKSQLQRILSLWHSYDIMKADRRQSPTMHTDKGFSLDILKTPSTPSLSNLEENACLMNDVVFQRVDETHSDIESDPEHEHHKNNVTVGICYENAKPESRKMSKNRQAESSSAAKNIRKLRQLTDEELRRKLNEGISKFAVENKQGRGKLRTQKSFELLRKQKEYNGPRSNRHNSIMDSNDASTLKSRPLEVSSEDSIPVFYELKELLVNKP